VHVHAEDPGPALSVGAAAGPITAVSVENMQAQHEAWARERRLGDDARGQHPGTRGADELHALVVRVGLHLHQLVQSAQSLLSLSRLMRTFVSPSVLFALFASIGLIAPGSPATAQESDDAALQRWVLEGELTSVLSRGNSENLALGLGATARRRWERDALRFETGWVQVETGRITVRAVGTSANFAVERDVEREKTAESLSARGRYDRSLSERVFVYGGVDWLRNTFAGIDSRTLLALGGGNTWVDSDRTRFATDYALTYTFEEDVVQNPFTDSDFAGVRFGYELSREVSESTVFESELIADLNLKETEDRRVDLDNSVTVDINDAIALKPSLRFSWRNLPALRDVPLFTAGGEDTGTVVTAPLKKLDTLFRLALVLNF